MKTENAPVITDLTYMGKAVLETSGDSLWNKTSNKQPRVVRVAVFLEERNLYDRDITYVRCYFLDENDELTQLDHKKYGLLYTDTGIAISLNKWLAQHVRTRKLVVWWSEHGMQGGSDYMHFDAFWE